MNDEHKLVDQKESIKDRLYALKDFLKDTSLHQELAIQCLAKTILDDWERAQKKLESISLGTTFFETLVDYLPRLFDNDPDFYNKSKIGSSTWSNMNRREYVAERDTVSKCILTLQLDILDAAVLMDKAGYTFMWNNKREMAIYFFIMNGIYDPMQVDNLLHECGFKRLFSHDLKVSSAIENILESSNSVVVERSTKTYIRFTTVSLERRVSEYGEEVPTSKSLLFYEFQIKNIGVVLKLYIGPGDSTLRQKLYEIAKSNQTVFTGMLNSLTARRTQIYAKDILTRERANMYRSYAEIETELRNKIEELLENEIPKIDEILVRNLV